MAAIPVGSELIGTTRVVGWRRVWARRRTDFHDAGGHLVAQAQIDWVLLDTRGAPTRIPAEFEPVFGAATATVGLARIVLGDPSPEACETDIVVRPHELDPMAHVNNAVYADWLEEAVIAAAGEPATRALPRVVRLEYAAPGDPGASLTASTWEASNGWSFRVRDRAGQDLLRARLEPASGPNERLVGD